MKDAVEPNHASKSAQPTELSVYVSHVAALLWPGSTSKFFTVHSRTSGALDGWQTRDFDLLIEQGRLQLNRQRQDLENIRSRGQFLFTSALGVLGLIGFALPEIARSVDGLAFVLWITSGALTLITILGAAAVVVARKTVGEVDASILSRVDSPIEETLARAYGDSISEGENTVATEITVFRDAVLFLVLGVVCLAIAWVVAIA